MLFRPLWLFLFMGYLVLLSWQLLTPVTIVSAGDWDKLAHFLSFFWLGCLSMLAWWNVPAARHIAIWIAYAALTEIAQHFIPGRSFSILDWIAGSLGTMVAVMLSLYVLKRVPAIKLKTN